MPFWFHISQNLIWFVTLYHNCTRERWRTKKKENLLYWLIYFSTCRTDVLLRKISVSFLIPYTTRLDSTAYCLCVYACVCIALNSLLDFDNSNINVAIYRTIVARFDCSNSNADVFASLSMGRGKVVLFVYVIRTNEERKKTF